MVSRQWLLLEKHERALGSKVSAKVRANIVAWRKRFGEDVEGRTCSFSNSFNSSSVGSRLLQDPTVLGPLCWMKPRTFIQPAHIERRLEERKQ